MSQPETMVDMDEALREANRASWIARSRKWHA